ncbi:MAG TPA: hypothetical protein VIP51_16585 [Eoetvoesiella sp.]
MTKKSAVTDRALRIELVRARATLERQRLARSVHDLADSLTPSALIKSMLPRSVSHKKPSDWLMQGFGLMQRYPLLASGASALLTRAGKRHRWWRLGAGLLLSWQVARSMSSSKNDDRPG